MTTNIVVLDTIAAAGADAVNTLGYLVVTGFPNNNERLKVAPNTYKKTAYSAGSAGSWAATFPAGAAGDSVQVEFQCIPSVGLPVTVTVNYTASGTLTAAANGTAFGAAATAAAAAITSAKGISSPFTVSGTTTPTLTASSAYLQIIGTIKRQPTTTYLTSVTNTIGTASAGKAAQLTAAGAVLNTDGVAFTGTTYDTYTWQYAYPSSNGSTVVTQPIKNMLFVNSTAGANYTAITNRLTYIFGADVTYTNAIIGAIAAG